MRRARWKRKNALCQTLRRRRKVWQIRGSCGSVRRASETPLSLRLTPVLEESGSRMTTAAGERGGCRICLHFYLRAFRCARRWPGRHGQRRGHMGPVLPPPGARRILSAFPFSCKSQWKIGLPPGAPPAPGERQRKEALASSFTTHALPPQLLCGNAALQGTAPGAGSTELSIQRKPIRAAPCFGK